MEKKDKIWLGICIVLGIVVFASIFCFYPVWVYVWGTQDATVLGMRGEQFSALNSFFTGLAFIGLLVTISFQYFERKRNISEFAAQKQILIRQSLDSAMFSYAEYMHELGKEMKNCRGEVYKIRDRVKFFPEKLNDYLENKLSLEEFTSYVNDLRCNVNMFGVWRRVFSMWLLRVEKSMLSNDNQEDFMRFYIKSLWHILPKTERLVLFLHMAFEGDEDAAAFDKQKVYFENSNTISSYFETFNYNDNSYTILIKLLMAITTSDKSAYVVINNLRVRDIVQKYSNPQEKKMSCPRRSRN